MGCHHSSKRAPNYITPSDHLAQDLTSKSYIYLGENHEIMGDRAHTNEIINLILKSNITTKPICLFTEVPSAYMINLDNLKSKKITREEFNNSLPSSYRRMYSNKILNLYLNKKINFYFFDLNSELNINKRNKYMATYAVEKIKLNNCQKNIFINGSRHLMDYLSQKGEKIVSLPTNINMSNSVTIAFIPAYCTENNSQVFNHIPDYFQKNIDNPRSSIIRSNWSKFNYFITLPINRNCQ